MRTLIALFPSLVFAAGACTAEEVVPEVGRAHVEIDRTRPELLPTFDIEVFLHGGVDDHDVVLVAASLVEYAEDPATIPIRADFDLDFDGFVPAEETVTTSLVNVGTTADDLAPLCVVPRAFAIHVALSQDFRGDLNTFDLSEPVDVTCR